MSSTLTWTLLNVTGAASVQTSDEFRITYLDNVGIHVIWSNGASTPTGDLFVEASLDGETWEDLDISPQPSISGNSGDHLISLTNVPFDKLRVRWDRTAGSIDLVIKGMAKTL